MSPFSIYFDSIALCCLYLLTLRDNKFLVALHVSFVRYSLSIVDHISKSVYPIAQKYATRPIGKHKILVTMTVPKNKAIDSVVCLKILARVNSTELLIGAQEGSIALNLMLYHTVTSPAVTHQYTPTGVYRREHLAHYSAVEHCTQEPIYSIL